MIEYQSSHKQFWRSSLLLSAGIRQQMELNCIVSSQPLTHGSGIHARFSLDRFDESALNGQESIKKGQHQQESGYKLGDITTLLQQVEASKSKNKNGLSLNTCSDVGSFSVFGPTVYLYFQFMRHLVMVFALLSIVSIVPIAYNAVEGTAYSPSAYGITGTLARTTIGAHLAADGKSSSGKTVNVAVAACNIFVLLAFWLYWKKYAGEESDRIEAQLDLDNYGAVVVEVDGNCFEELQLAAFLGQFGTLQEIQKVVDIKNALYYAKQIVQLTNANKLLAFLQAKDVTRREQLANTISQNEHRIRELKPRLVQQLQQINSSEEVVLRYFVKFDSHKALEGIVRAFSEYEGCCGKPVPKELLVNNRMICVSRQECQPYEIYWQNQSVTWRESCLPHVLLLLVVNLAVVGCLIAIGLLLASSRPVYYQPSLSSNSLSLAAVASSGDQASIDSWCLATQPTPESEQLCGSVYHLYRLRIAISVAIGVAVLVTKLIVKRVVLFFRPHLRFRDKVEEAKEILMHLFINYSVVTVLITLSLQTNLFGSAIVSIFISCVQDPTLRQRLVSLQQYYDYTSLWYLDYGCQLILNFFIMAVFPHSLSPLAEAVLRRIKAMRAPHLKYEVLINEQLELATFELEDHYASTLCVLLAGLVFAGNIPLMVPLLFLTLLVKFYAAKYLFLHLNRPPAISDRTLAQKIPPIFLFIITAYLLNSLWAFGVQSVFAPESALFSDRGITADSNAHNPFEALLVFMKRLAGTWQLAMVYAVGVIAIVLRKLLLKVYSNYILERAHPAKHASAESEEDRPHPQLPPQPRKLYKKQISSAYLEVLDYIRTVNY